MILFGKLTQEEDQLIISANNLKIYFQEWFLSILRKDQRLNKLLRTHG